MNAVDPLVRNNVRVTGSDAATRTMVFVHGFGTDQTAWREVAASFAGNSRIVLLDSVGAGQSDPAAFVQHRYLSLGQYARDLLEVCRALGIRDAVLVGHSVGAMISVLAAIAEPDHFSRLVLIGASPRYLDDDGYHGGFSRADLDALYSAISNGYTEWADHYAVLAMQNPSQPQLARDFAQSLKSIPANRAFTVLCSIFQSDHRQDLKYLNRPTLIIQSQHDVAVPIEVARYLHEQIGGSQMTVIEASGHLPHVSAPAAVVAAIERFLGGEMPG